MDKNKIIYFLIVVVFGLWGYIMIDKSIESSLNVGDDVVAKSAIKLTFDWNQNALMKDGCETQTGSLFEITRVSTLSLGSQEKKSIVFLSPLSKGEDCSGWSFLDHLEKIEK